MKQKSKTLKEIRLKIPHEEIKGLTVSLHTSSNELVVHLDMQADLRITCVGTREQIIDALKVFYQARKGESMIIYGVRQKSLGMYTTQESDVVKGISRIPLSFTRL